MLADIIIELSNESPERLSELGANARSYYDDNFNKQELLNRIDKYFE